MADRNHNIQIQASKPIVFKKFNKKQNQINAKNLDVDGYLEELEYKKTCKEEKLLKG